MSSAPPAVKQWLEVADGAHGSLHRGGANNRSDRISFNLTPQQCIRLVEAADAAFEQGLPFNRYATIAWGKSGGQPKRSVTMTGDWFSLCRNWMGARGSKLSWGWVQERGPMFGAHCHALFHVPPLLDPLFRTQPTSWVRQILADEGLTYVAGTMQVQRVSPLYLPHHATAHLWSHVTDDEHELRRRAYRMGISGKLHYMLKCGPEGLDDELGLTWLMHKPWGQECAVFGKRLGTWQFRTTS